MFFLISANLPLDVFLLFFERKKTPIDDVAPQSRSEIQYVISTLYRILGQNLGEREIRKIFVTGNAAEEEEEREREEEREKKKKVRKHKPLGAQYSLVHSLLESFNKFI